MAGKVFGGGVFIGEGCSLERERSIRANAVLRKAQTLLLLLVISRSYFRLCVCFVKTSSVSHC